MSIKRIRSKSITSAPSPVQRLALFGPPLLLEGEDPAVYDALLARICAAIKPADIIDEIIVNDVVVLQWEVLRWRRSKLALIRVAGLKALEDFLPEVLDYHRYSEDYAECLANTLQEILPGEPTEEFAQKLAHQSARNEPDADAKVNALLAAAELSMDRILDRAKANKAERLVQGYARREPWAVEEVQELLDAAGRTMDDLMAPALAKELDNIERFDRLTAIAETRRNAGLHEIDRRRAVLGQALRRSLQEAEDAEFKEIEATPAKGKSAA
jgi:hypothetical protein